MTIEIAIGELNAREPAPEASGLSIMEHALFIRNLA